MFRQSSLPLWVMCHLSCVTFDMSHVTCHIKKNVGASQWRVGYQLSLPSLVFGILEYNSMKNSILVQIENIFFTG